jgi:very-short-patch-repair endonuclease
MKQTKKERHGDENYTNSKKAKQTKKERYNNENYVNIEKMKKTKKEKYGYEFYTNREKYFNTIKDRPKKFYSSISQELFWKIYNKLSIDFQKNINFAELNHELKLKNFKNESFYYDFSIGKLIIEFNGFYWHSLENVIQRDKIKKELAETLGFFILIIDEKEYLKNKDKVVNFCIEKIKERNLNSSLLSVS